MINRLRTCLALTGTLLLCMLLPARAQSGEGISPAFPLDTSGAFSVGEGISAAFILDTTVEHGTGEGISAAFALNTNFPNGQTVSAVSSAFVLNTQPANGTPAALRVRLLDRASHDPVAGALVIVRRGLNRYAAGLTGANGEYLTVPLIPRPYTLELRAAGHATRILNIPPPAAGQPWATTLLLTPEAPAPALQTVVRTPPASAFRLAVPPNEANPLAPVLLVYNPFTQDFSATAAVNPLRQTVVMAHGWRWSGTPNADVLEWARDMARKMDQSLPPSARPNILVWDWKHEATRAVPPIENAASQGCYLGQALYARLGPTYAQRLHFIGHSLGTIVCKNACDYLHGDYPRASLNPLVPWNRGATQPHVTLMDEAEIASIFGRNVVTASALGWMIGGGGAGILTGVNELAKDWKDPIPASAARLDNYISLVGLQHSEALNVCLSGWIGQTIDPIEGHAYAHQWYRRSILERTAPPALGWRLSPEGADLFPPASPFLTNGSLWRESPLPGDPLRLVQVAQPLAQECITSNLASYALSLPAGVGGLVGEGIQSARQATGVYLTNIRDNTVRTVGNVTTYLSDKTGSGWDAFRDGAGNFADRIIADSPGDWSLASFSGILLKNAAAGNRQARDNGTPGVTQPFAWMTITLPADAAMLAFDFKVTGDPADDCLVCALNDQNLFTLPLKFAPDGTPVSTDMMDISAFAGQEVELMFGLAGGTSTDAELLIDGLRLITVPPPSLTAQTTANTVALRWPASATGWTLEASDTLAAASWLAISPGASAVVEAGDIVLTQPVDRARRFYRLRRN